MSAKDATKKASSRAGGKEKKKGETPGRPAVAIGWPVGLREFLKISFWN
jgi:hypothetical protein